MTGHSRDDEERGLAAAGFHIVPETDPSCTVEMSMEEYLALGLRGSVVPPPVRVAVTIRSDGPPPVATSLVRSKAYFGGAKTRLAPVRPASRSVANQEEIAKANAVLAEVDRPWGHTRKKVATPGPATACGRYQTGVYVPPRGEIALSLLGHVIKRV